MMVATRQGREGARGRVMFMAGNSMMICMYSSGMLLSEV
jgi:hypothetical protein